MQRHIVQLLLLSIMATSACVRQPPAATPTPTDYSDLSIKMSYILGWGEGGYELSVNARGNVSYGACYMPWPTHSCLPDQRSGTIDAEQVRALVDEINRADVWAIKNGSPSKIIDSDGTRIAFSIRLGGQSVEFEYPNGACNGTYRGAVPQRLCELQEGMEAIKKLAVRATWPPTSTP